MNPQTLKITPPTGFEIDKDKSTFEEIVFKPITPVLPKRWEDLQIIKGYFVSSNCRISQMICGLNNSENKSVWPTRELAEASIALAQLCQLRDVYNDGWMPDWNNRSEDKFVIRHTHIGLDMDISCVVSFVLSFKTRKLRDQFFTNFKDLLEVAKPLL